MPSGKVWMGWWGDFGGPKQKGIVQYSLSPFQQKAMGDAFSSYLFNGYRRIVAQVPYFAIPFGFGYGIYTWANSYGAYLESKEGHYATAEKEAAAAHHAE
ncbi:putative ubiquinol-cytochrome c reductase complex 11 kDa protein [Calocera viscosa TUFC12733]|uniref:Cytochrome b-c1 complex subunit 8 n=1 Tax=Calocera viscosa (strain TUFC12733) TaxID=1330018 RepID=A0A167PWT0_CALVF|nr:putative ubiquinol-cytochrome c reductase complex 11 kDa protein [Calocera viscosa TUFC12733]